MNSILITLDEFRAMLGGIGETTARKIPLEERMNLETLNESEYRKCAVLLAELLGLDGDTKEKIQKCFQRMGIKNFF